MNYALLSIMSVYDVLWNSEGQATTNRIWYRLTRLTMGSVLSPIQGPLCSKTRLTTLSLGSSLEMKESQEEQMQKHNPSSLKET